MLLLRRAGPVVALLLFSALTPVRAPAQILSPGARLRITAPAQQVDRRVASLIAARGDTLTVRYEGAADPVNLPVGQLTRVEVSRGRHGHLLTGAVAGLVAGTVVGGAIGASYDDEESAWVSPIIFVLAAGLGASAGLVAGGVTGAAIRTERWVTIPPSLLRPTVGMWRPAEGGLGLRVSVFF